MFIRPSNCYLFCRLLRECRGAILVIVVLLALGVVADWAIDHGYLPKGQSTAG